MAKFVNSLVIHFWEVSHSIASFPGRSHLNSLNTYSMQMVRGKAWEVWSCVMMSGRQRIDGGCSPMKGLEALVISVRELNTRALTRQHQYRSSFMMLGMGQCKQESLWSSTAPPPPPCLSTLCLRDATACDQISWAFPFLHTESNSKTEGGEMRLVLVHTVLGVASLEYSCIELFGV